MTLLRDRNPSAVRLLAAAAQLAEARGGVLTVLCPPEIAATAGFETWIAERLAAYSISQQIEVAPAEPDVLDKRIVDLGCRLLAIAAKAAGGTTAELRDWAEKFTCDILVVR